MLGAEPRGGALRLERAPAWAARAIRANAPFRAARDGMFCGLARDLPRSGGRSAAQECSAGGTSLRVTTSGTTKLRAGRHAGVALHHTTRCDA